ncbi:MAG: cobalamin ABC transporter substrate-binding protein [Labilithrix sp.]|nr:cobalamin ABC transporter substrate-binding protein [Labilithrix sp.]
MLGSNLGCDPARDPNAPSRPLPSYAGRASELFDDTIEPAGVGLDFDKGYTPRADPVLRERAQVSDAILRVKVSTVTTKRDGPEAHYQLGLQTVEKLAGSHPPTEQFSVTINKTSESHGIMKNFESRLVGYPFVAFVREFVRPDGDREIHFHLAPDSKEVKSAVGDAILLGEVNK